jgi:hypothetical protein
VEHVVFRQVAQFVSLDALVAHSLLYGQDELTHGGTATDAAPHHNSAHMALYPRLFVQNFTAIANSLGGNVPYTPRRFL